MAAIEETFSERSKTGGGVSDWIVGTVLPGPEIVSGQYTKKVQPILEKIRQVPQKHHCSLQPKGQLKIKIKFVLCLWKFIIIEKEETSLENLLRPLFCHCWQNSATYSSGQLFFSRPLLSCSMKPLRQRCFFRFNPFWRRLAAYISYTSPKACESALSLIHVSWINEKWDFTWTALTQSETESTDNNFEIVGPFWDSKKTLKSRFLVLCRFG